jgi:hypothetical protein
VDFRGQEATLGRRFLGSAAPGWLSLFGDLSAGQLF